MGVTYKLKQEVVDLIIQKKKEDPSLSCRKLEILLQESFHLDVSKSSINAVIKEFDLSNPVGRKATNPSKNFNIPQEKKQQLLAQVAPFLPPMSIVEEAPEAAPGQAIAIENSENIPSLAPDEEAPPEPLKLRKDPLDMEQGTESSLKKDIVAIGGGSRDFVWDGDRAVLWEKAGLFFLWAFIQNLFKRRLVGEVLAKVAGFDTEHSGALEATVFLPFFDISKGEDLRNVSLDFLWKMMEVDPKQGITVLEDFLGKNLNPASVGILLGVELETALLKAQYFNCLTKDGRRVCLSGDLMGILNAGENGKSLPIFSAVRRAVDVFKVGKPLLINSLGKETPGFMDDLLLLTGQAGVLDKIELVAENNQKAWEANLTGDERRDVIVAMDYSTMEINKIIFDVIDNPYEYYDIYTDQKHFLVEGRWVDGDHKWRAIVIQKDGFSEKKVLLTNMDVSKINMTDVFEYYLRNVNAASFLSTSHEIMGFDSIKYDKFINSKDIMSNFRIIYKLFENMMVRLYSADCSSNILNSIYNLSGYVQQRKEAVVVRFVIPEDFQGTRLLGDMISKVGAAAFVDQIGRRYYFSIEK